MAQDGLALRRVDDDRPAAGEGLAHLGPGGEARAAQTHQARFLDQPEGRVALKGDVIAALRALGPDSDGVRRHRRHRAGYAGEQVHAQAALRPARQQRSPPDGVTRSDHRYAGCADVLPERIMKHGFLHFRHPFDSSESR